MRDRSGKLFTFYSKLTITVQFDPEKATKEEVEIPIVEATYQRVMIALETLINSHQEGKY